MPRAQGAGPASLDLTERAELALNPLTRNIDPGLREMPRPEHYPMRVRLPAYVLLPARDPGSWDAGFATASVDLRLRDHRRLVAPRNRRLPRTARGDRLRFRPILTFHYGVCRPSRWRSESGRLLSSGVCVVRTPFARVHSGFGPAVLTVVLLVISPPVWTQQQATAPEDGELLRLTVEQLRDSQYHLPLFGDEETPIRFRGGQGSIRHGTGATERVQAGLVDDLVAFGDLDGDAVADAAVVVFINPGGSGTFIHLLAMHDDDGTPVQAGREFLGDRVCVERLAISGGHILVTMLAHGPGDGLCCPSIKISRAFTLRGDRLVPIRVLAITSPLPARRSRRASRFGGVRVLRPPKGWPTWYITLAAE